MGRRWDGLRRRAPVLLAGLCGAGLCAVWLMLLAPGVRAGLDQFAGDLVLRQVPPPPATGPGVTIIDIDSAALHQFGPWPWRRDRMAHLIRAAAEAGAAVVAVDILFAGADSRSPVTMARQLAEAAGRPELAGLIPGPDDDQQLAEAMAAVPTVLGFAMSPQPGPAPRSVPVLMPQGAAGLLWSAPGAEVPVAPLAAAAAGLGALALPVGPDGTTRQVPLFISIDGTAVPGLAFEALRLRERAPMVHLDPATGRFAAGALSGRMDRDGMLRLLPDPAAAGLPLRLPATEVLERRHDPKALTGRVVLIGGSAPEIGAIRRLADGRAAPGVEVQAQAMLQVLAGLSPRAADPTLSLGLALAAGLIGAALPLAPPLMALVGVGLGLSALGLLVWGLMQRMVLLSPGLPALLLLAGFFAALIASALITRQQAAQIRRRFEQHLAPEVVAKIVRAPHLLRQKGERRVITALFTDLEGFSALTRRLGPERLIDILDQYFEGVTGIILAHGGMVDKIVGDAVHALFNAPLDQPDHAEAALRCALAIIDWTEAQRQRPELAAAGLGRTRIGIETGPAIVGDVGRGAKLDYTAHGEVINAAARLETKNKSLGTSICAGPGMAAACPPGALRPLTRVDLRGIGSGIEVFVPATLPSL